MPDTNLEASFTERPLKLKSNTRNDSEELIAFTNKFITASPRNLNKKIFHSLFNKKNL